MAKGVNIDDFPFSGLEIIRSEVSDLTNPGQWLYFGTIPSKRIAINRTYKIHESLLPYKF